MPYIEWAPKAGGTKRVYADTWEQEGFAATATVTEHAVEDGSKVTDHYKPDPVTLRCVMFFSECPVRGDLDEETPGQIEEVQLAIPPYPNNTPLLSPAGLTNAVGAGVNAVGAALGFGGSQGPTKASALRFAEAPGRLRSVVEKLMQLRDEGILFAVGSSIARFESMALREARVDRTSADGDSGAIALDFVQVQFVTTESAEALPLPLEPRGQVKKSTTTGSAQDVPEGPKKSAAAALLDTALGR